jgi:hypothetical protein
MKSSMSRRSLLFLSLFLVSLSGCIGFAYARPNPENRQARITINRTNAVLRDAQDSVRGRGVYTGDLALAYSNQRYAIDLYNNGQYHNAIEYSLYARRLGYQALQSNGARYRLQRYSDESRLPSRDDRQLKEELSRAYPDRPVDDQSVLTFSFDFNVK